MRLRTLTVLLLAAAAWPASGRAEIAQVNGIDLYYEVHGNGEPLLLLHQFSNSGIAWKPYLDELAAAYRVIVPDLRGHGRSTNPSNKFSHRQAALDIFALLDQLGVERFRAMGASSGGMTLLHMATQQPNRPVALVLVGAAPYFTDQDRAIKAKVNPESLTEQEMERLRKIHVHGDEQIRSLRRQFRDSKDSYADMNFTPPLLSTISARTLIVHGDRDAFFPVSIAAEMYRAIPVSYLWIVPNGGHIPIRRHADEFTHTALEFLSGEWE